MTNKRLAANIFEELLTMIAEEDNIFERCSSRLLSTDYANGRSESIGNVLGYISKLKKKYLEINNEFKKTNKKDF